MRITGKENNILILKELGNRLKEMRINAGITQAQMCKLSGLSHSTIQRIESGDNVKIETILNVMRTLSILENLEVVIPEQRMSPTMNLDQKKKRQRVSVKKQTKEETEWRWGEDK